MYSRFQLHSNFPWSSQNTHAQQSTLILHFDPGLTSSRPCSHIVWTVLSVAILLLLWPGGMNPDVEEQNDSGR